MSSVPQSTIDLIDTAIITGGGGGIGKALASYLISQGKKVIIVGRTESNLQSTAKEIGATTYYVLDTGDIKSIPGFAKKVIEEYPNVNCLINNAGVQRPFEFPGSGGKDYGFDLEKADQELNINIRGPMHLSIAFLPHFTSLSGSKKSVIINVSSVLGFLPSSLINPVYNGTKAWLHSFSVNMRAAFAENQKVRVVEVVPPKVTTALHRDRLDPHDNAGGSALTVEQFIDEVAAGLKEGKDTISAGPGKKVVQTWEEGLGAMYAKAVRQDG